jgi:hypothetical protein
MHGESRNAYSILYILKGGDRSEDLRVDGRIILEWFLRKYGGRVWSGCIWLRIGANGGLL